ncbi:VOC family protein [Rahnella sp. SAP-1]|uniref:VOC family protein n=1 Tax=Rouxiella aceris TaxID=2703884 RepID=A0A848MDM7_9GAMM|nr:VOC family protein [Rouxiella aceris]NMP26217.1 VOC family protein [Rouxiella aceris]
MLDHIFLSVSNLERSVAFYTVALAPLGITSRVDYDGKDGPAGHPDLKGFGANGRIFFWLREGTAAGGATHVGFVANSTEIVDQAYAAAIKAGATDNGAPGIRLYYDPRYYAAGVIDPDGYTLEFVYKSWQH